MSPRGGFNGPALPRLRQSIDPAVGVKLEDFYAYLPQHGYIFVPSREVWPAQSVNGRLPKVPALDDDGDPIINGRGEVEMIKPATWLDKHRAVEQMTWAPGSPMLIEDKLMSNGAWVDRAGCACFNLYRPAPTWPHGDASEAARWVELLEILYPDDAAWLLGWFAQRVQHPEVKINHALVLGGGVGIGKDTLLEPVRRAIGAWNFMETTPGEVLGRFNPFVKAVILRINEARDLGEFDRFAFHDHTKIYLASPPDVLMVDEKNLKPYAIQNVCGVIITTNHKTNGLFLPADDRRHYVAWSSQKQGDLSDDYFRDLWAWYEAEGFAHVAVYLATYDLSDFRPKAPPIKTPAFWDIVNANRAPEDAEMADLIDKLGVPTALILPELIDKATGDFASYLKDRRNARSIPHRLETAGYVAVRNPQATDGLWKLNGYGRKVVYVDKRLDPRAQYLAAETIRKAYE